MRGEDKPPFGILFTCNTHSTSLGPKNNLISGDVHGLAAQFLENYYGSSFVAPGFAGSSGNIDPWYRVLPDFKTNNGWIPESILLSTLVGEEVVHVTDTMTQSATNTSIRTLFKTIEMPAKPRDVTASTPADVPFNITVARLGDIAFVGWGGEVFNEIGRLVKSSSPFPHTVIITHCNGAAGYLPTAPSYPDGGYEVQSSPFAPGADEVLIKETLRLLNTLCAP